MATICVAVTAAQVGVASAEPWVRHTIGGGTEETIGADGVRLGDVNNDGLLDAVVGFEGSNVTRLFLNPGTGEAVRQPWSSVSLGSTPNVEDAFLVDIDGDGRLDAVSSDESGGGQNPKGQIRVHFAPSTNDLLNADNWTTQSIPAASNVTEWMFGTAMQIDGQFGPDLVVAGKNHNQGSGAPTSEIGWLRAPADPRNEPDAWQYTRIGNVGWTMSVINSDMNNDGHVDILLSDRKGSASGVRWLQNPGTGADEAALTAPWTEHVITTGVSPMFMSLADIDGDGREDLVVPTLNDTLFWYERLDDSGDAWQDHEINWPNSFGEGKAVATADLNGDGRLDLILSSASRYIEEPGLVWLEQPSDPRDPDWVRHDLSGPDSYGKYDLVQLIDLDGDGDLDVLTTEEGRNVTGEGHYGFGVIWFENPAEVPEPGSISLLMLGAGMLLGRRRRGQGQGPGPAPTGFQRT